MCEQRKGPESNHRYVHATRPTHAQCADALQSKIAPTWGRTGTCPRRKHLDSPSKPGTTCVACTHGSYAEPGGCRPRKTRRCDASPWELDESQHCSAKEPQPPPPAQMTASHAPGPQKCRKCCQSAAPPDPLGTASASGRQSPRERQSTEATNRQHSCPATTGSQALTSHASAASAPAGGRSEDCGCACQFEHSTRSMPARPAAAELSGRHARRPPPSDASAPGHRGCPVATWM